MKLNHAKTLLASSCFRQISRLTVNVPEAQSCEMFSSCIADFVIYCRHLQKIRIKDSDKLVDEDELGFFNDSTIQLYAHLIRFVLDWAWLSYFFIPFQSFHKSNKVSVIYSLNVVQIKSLKLFKKILKTDVLLLSFNRAHSQNKQLWKGFENAIQKYFMMLQQLCEKFVHVKRLTTSHGLCIFWNWIF